MKGERGRLKRWSIDFIFSGPTLIAFATVLIVPFLYGVYLTLTNWNGLSNHHQFVGIANYLQTFQDQSFWVSMGVTVKYVIVTVVLVNVIAFALAYALTTGVKGQNIFRTTFFAPSLIGGIVLGFIWQFIFQNVIVYLGQILNMPALSNSMLATPSGAFWSLVLVSVWQYSGYMMIIYIAGLMAVPQELVDAASIDGANALIRLRAIVLPMIMPAIVVCVFLTLQRGFLNYDLNLSLTAGGPYGSTVMVPLYVYQQAFTSQNFGLGQAEAFVLFIIVAIISFIQVYVGKKQEVEA